MKEYDYAAQKNALQISIKTMTDIKKTRDSAYLFRISFTNTMMNHARALVHIYYDGSVVISTAAVEMGQASTPNWCR
jgi:xanthine dehydrogenase large subunit